MMINTTESLKDPRKVDIFLFGSQTDSLSKESIVEIKGTLQDELSRKWVLDAVAELPRHWDALSKSIPAITDTIGDQGRQSLIDLESWLAQGQDDRQDAPLPAGIEAQPARVLTPLIVLTQLAQYRRYLALRQPSRADGASVDLQEDVVAEGKTSALGFCMGLLASFAVASSKNQEELDRYGTAAVALGMVGGALLDAQDVWNPSKAYATAWNNAKQKEKMQKIVDNLFPETFLSVLYDEARATINTSQRAASRLLRQLHAAGLTTAEVKFSGDLHSTKPEAKSITDQVIAFCNEHPGLQLAEAGHLALQTFTNTGDGKPIEAGAGHLHEVVMRAFFMQQCEWYDTISAVKAAQLEHSDALAVTFGPGQCVPPTVTRRLGSKLVHFKDLPVEKRNTTAKSDAGRRQQKDKRRPTTTPGINDDTIAIVGMSIKTAGAEDFEEFSDMLRTGESQHKPVTPDRIKFDTLFRDEPKQYYANFLKDVDAFDNKFFKRSPRESAHMDPQHRLLLQAAYQATEQSGYFTEAARSPQQDDRDRKHVAVYIGCPATDYENHVICENANAYTGTGNIQSFIPGRVAHHFGWTGPALVVDTACSSSTVAIHIACQNLLTGECNAALAGGVTVDTNPAWFDNLAAASFLSPTGQCKPFDEKADGYCRAEGVACVFLKRLSDAVADGNPILGCISSTAVYQNTNATPIFVPNSPSLYQLFKDVIRKAKVEAKDFSLIEAHGTGTAVGDPAEYAAIRQAMGGSEVRSKPMPIGSAKGHVGHAEGASGAISLIKVLMMMRENFVPPQASFTKMNPAIKASPSDMIEVNTSLRSWDEDDEDRFKVVLINNYGASGSNSAMVVTQSPNENGSSTSLIRHGNQDLPEEKQPRFPFMISGLDVRSIKEYASRLSALLQSDSKYRTHVPFTLADISFNLSRQSNPDLSQNLTFSCRSVAELNEKLSSISSAASSKPAELGIESVKPERPVILCFGGQVSTFVGLDRKLYDSVAILRHHLDECNAVILSEPLNLGSIYPDIFSRTPFEDPVRLQTMLFAMQYASAKSWIDCGLSGKIAAVVGHSFGELTALCISGVLSLQDAIKLVASRAKLVREAWGPDKGSMMAVEADESLVEELLAEAGEHLHGNSETASHSPASIACYNGPRSFTLAGSVKAIDAVVETLAKNSNFSTIKNKRLNVTNAFHSSLVDPLVDRLAEVGNDLVFNEPIIPVERATKNKFSGPFTSTFVPEHMRQPVFFNHALQRLAKEHPSAIFLEAGSSSTITVMASRALSKTTPSGSHHFQAVNITNDKGLDGLTDATTSLWKQGLRVSFWAHQVRQTNEYASLFLPPYQFEKTRHWVERKSLDETVSKAAASLARQLQPGDHDGQGKQGDGSNSPPWTFIGYQDDTTERPRFRVNMYSPKYMEFTMGHVITQTAPICPAGLEADMAIEAFFSLHPGWKEKGFQPVVMNMVNDVVLCQDPSLIVWLDLICLISDETLWSWAIYSANKDTPEAVYSPDHKYTQQHVRGRFQLHGPDDEAYKAEFARFERLVDYERCKELLAAPGQGEDVDVLSGRNVYPAFSGIVEYSEQYKGVRAIVGRGNEAAARVQRRPSGETWFDVYLAESFGAVAGIWVNCMMDAAPTDMFIVHGFESLLRSPKRIINPDQTQEAWHVYARVTKQSENEYTTDAFVFNAANGELAEVHLGAQWIRLSKTLMSRHLTQCTKDKTALVNPNAAVAALGKPAGVSQPQKVVDANKEANATVNKGDQAPSSGGIDLSYAVRNVVATVAGLEVDNLTLDTELADVGIDSLMGMELRREVDLTFKCSVDQAELLHATNIRELVDFMASVLGTSAQVAPAIIDDEEDDKVESSSDHDRWSSSDRDASTSPSDPGTPTPDLRKSAEEPIDFSAIREESFGLQSEYVNTGKRDVAARKADAEGYIAKYTAGWAEAMQLSPSAVNRSATRDCHDAVVLVTGATGSLGSHLVAALAENPVVKTVVCVNRYSSTPVETRQAEAFSTRGISLSDSARSKLRILETDTFRPQLGLDASEYDWLVKNATHIVHNAWPMSLTRPIAGYQQQFQTMRNLLDLARDAACREASSPEDFGKHNGQRIGFSLISSIAVVGESGLPRVLEDRVPLDSGMPAGYAEAKWVCERMLDETLHKYPSLFRPMVTRPGQISGSTTSGVWNPVEHFCFMVKSAQSLRAWPALDGILQWVPVDTVASAIAELLQIGNEVAAPKSSPVYHIDNPVGQPWKDMSVVLAEALDIPSDRIVSFQEWVRLISESSLPETENPAIRLLDFLHNNFETMGCGGMIMDTTKAQAHSATMAAVGPVSDEIARSYVREWKEMGFLSS